MRGTCGLKSKFEKVNPRSLQDFTLLLLGLNSCMHHEKTDRPVDSSLAHSCYRCESLWILSNDDAMSSPYAPCMCQALRLYCLTAELFKLGFFLSPSFDGFQQPRDMLASSTFASSTL